jgi:hemoglobin
MLGAAAVLVAGCASRDSAMMEKKPLYDRLGGKPAITAVVDDFVGNVAGDSRINRRFADANIPNLKTMLVDQICQASGGPCTYKGETMKAAHAGMKITDAEFTALVEPTLPSPHARPGADRPGLPPARVLLVLGGWQSVSTR